MSSGSISQAPYSATLSSESEDQPRIHPFETFRPSMDYNTFNSEVLRPYLRDARVRRSDRASSQLRLTFAPNRSSIEELLSFLEETDYNRTLHDTSSSVMDSQPPNILPLDGFISGNRPDCFVWEGGFFEKGASVILGDSGRMGVVKGICGIGRNFTMRGIEEYGRSPEEVPICRMVISACPTSAALSLAHRLASLFFSPFLGSMADFLGAGGMEDVIEKGDISASSLSTITSSSEIRAGGDEEYSEVEDN